MGHVSISALDRTVPFSLHPETRKANSPGTYPEHQGQEGEFGKSMSIPDFSQPLDCETIQQSTLDFGHILMCATELGKAL